MSYVNPREAAGLLQTRVVQEEGGYREILDAGTEDCMIRRYRKIDDRVLLVAERGRGKGTEGTVSGWNLLAPGQPEAWRITDAEWTAEFGVE